MFSRSSIRSNVNRKAITRPLLVAPTIKAPERGDFTKFRFFIKNHKHIVDIFIIRRKNIWNCDVFGFIYVDSQFILIRTPIRINHSTSLLLFMKYRLREKYWRKGYVTEIVKGLLEFGFGVLKMDEITADVAVQNLNSNKILEKFMSLKIEFYNKTDYCMDRQYEVL